MTDLASTVFVLEPPRAFNTSQFMGRAAHKLFLTMLNELGRLSGKPVQYGGAAKTLHDLDAALPFTVSPLFQSDNHHWWMRATALEPELSAALELMASLLPGHADVDGWRVVFALLSQHDWARSEAFADFTSHAWQSPQSRLNIEFFTPTAMKSVGLYRPLPDPALAFRLLYERTLKIDGLQLKFRPSVEYLEGFAQYLLSINNYDLRFTRVQMQHPIPAFYGTVTYQIERENTAFEKRARLRRDRDGDASLLLMHEDLMSNHDQYTQLINFLGCLLFYTGLGSQTGQGMGMARKVEAVKSSSSG